MLAIGSRRVKGVATTTRHAVGDQVHKVTHRKGGEADAVVAETPVITEPEGTE